MHVSHASRSRIFAGFFLAVLLLTGASEVGCGEGEVIIGNGTGASAGTGGSHSVSSSGPGGAYSVSSSGYGPGGAYAVSSSGYGPGGAYSVSSSGYGGTYSVSSSGYGGTYAVSSSGDYGVSAVSSSGGPCAPTCAAAITHGGVPCSSPAFGPLVFCACGGIDSGVQCDEPCVSFCAQNPVLSAVDAECLSCLMTACPSQLATCNAN